LLRENLSQQWFDSKHREWEAKPQHSQKQNEQRDNDNDNAAYSAGHILIYDVHRLLHPKKEPRRPREERQGCRGSFDVRIA